MVYFEGTDVLPRIEAESGELVSPDFTPLGKQRIQDFMQEIKTAYDAGMNGEALSTEQSKHMRLYSDKVIGNVTSNVDSNMVKQQALAGNMENALIANIDLVNEKIGNTYKRLLTYKDKVPNGVWLNQIAEAEAKMQLELSAVSGKVEHTKMVSTSLIAQKTIAGNVVSRRNGYKSDVTGKSISTKVETLGNRKFKHYYVPTTELYDNDDSLLEFYSRIHYGDVNITHINVTESTAKEIGILDKPNNNALSDEQLAQWRKNGYITMLDYTNRKDTVSKMLKMTNEERIGLIILELSNRMLLSDEDKQKLKNIKAICDSVINANLGIATPTTPTTQTTITANNPVEIKTQRAKTIVRNGNNNNINTKG